MGNDIYVKIDYFSNKNIKSDKFVNMRIFYPF